MGLTRSITPGEEASHREQLTNIELQRQQLRQRRGALNHRAHLLLTRDEQKSNNPTQPVYKSIRVPQTRHRERFVTAATQRQLPRASVTATLALTNLVVPQTHSNLTTVTVDGKAMSHNST